MTIKKDKEMTIDELAVIINSGFNGQMDYMEKRFGQIENKMATKAELDEVKKDVKYIKENLKSATELEKDVEYIKNTLGVPALKK